MTCWNCVCVTGAVHRNFTFKGPWYKMEFKHCVCFIAGLFLAVNLKMSAIFYSPCNISLLSSDHWHVSAVCKKKKNNFLKYFTLSAFFLLNSLLQSLLLMNAFAFVIDPWLPTELDLQGFWIKATLGSVALPVPSCGPRSTVRLTSPRYGYASSESMPPFSFT